MTKEKFKAWQEKYKIQIEEIRLAAHHLHQSVNEIYGDNLPYGFHLDMVVEGIINYGHLVCVREEDVVPMFFGMYSKLAVGATLRNEKYNGDAPSDKDYSDSEFHVNWQVSLLGMEAGSPVIRGFIELGTGEQGIILAGLRYKF